MIRYIAFEGIDGSGKTTQVSLLSTWLVRQGYTPIMLVEPTFGRYGREIRRRIQEGWCSSLDEQIELFTLDRKEHVRRTLRPLLGFVREHDGFFVIQDRCYLSAPAYQAHGQPAMMSLLQTQQAIAPCPDIIFLIDAPVGQALKRKIHHDSQRNVFEHESVLTRVRSNYLYLANKASERILLLDGSADINAVHTTILTTLRPELPCQDDKEVYEHGTD